MRWQRVSRQVHPRKPASQGRPKGRPEHLCSVWGVGAPGCGAKQRGGRAPRTLTPITTVSSPLNLGMNLSPRRISASLRGRNRHITLMLHSAGSAISAGGREGARAGAGGRGSAQPERRPRTHSPQRGRLQQPPRSFSAGHREFRGRAAPAARRPGRWAVYQPPAPRTADLPSLAPPCPTLHPDPLPVTTRPDQATRRERASPGSDLPGSCALSHPASAPARSPARPSAPRPRPPLPPGAKTSLRRSAQAARGSILGLVVASPEGGRTRMLGVGFLKQHWCQGATFRGLQIWSVCPSQEQDGVHIKYSRIKSLYITKPILSLHLNRTLMEHFL